MYDDIARVRLSLRFWRRRPIQAEVDSGLSWSLSKSRAKLSLVRKPGNRRGRRLPAGGRGAARRRAGRLPGHEKAGRKSRLVFFSLVSLSLSSFSAWRPSGPPRGGTKISRLKVYRQLSLRRKIAVWEINKMIFSLCLDDWSSRTSEWR